MFSWLGCGSSDTAAPASLGLLTGVCRDAVSGLSTRESVARPLLTWAPEEELAVDGWALVALEGEVVLVALLLEAGRVGAGRR
jgi:hypothetical protein